jgi:tryptophan halogenase
MPAAHDPLADAMSDDDVSQRLLSIREQVRTAVARMPDHEDFLREYCPAEPPRMMGGHA